MSFSTTKSEKNCGIELVIVSAISKLAVTQLTAPQ
jgi:hypothetical protein